MENDEFIVDFPDTEVDLRRLRGDVMDMIVQFLRWDRAATERGCYGVILPILYVVVALTSDRLGLSSPGN